MYICTCIRVYLGMSMYVYLRGGSPGGASFFHNATLSFAALVADKCFSLLVYNRGS